MEQLDIAFGVDGRYLPHVAAVIASIVRNAKDAKFRFIILHDGVSADRRSLVEAAAPAAEFYWAVISDDDVPAYRDKDHFSRPILFRLALDKLAPVDCHRLIYLDCDLILLRDVRELWNAELAGAPLGAIVDCNSDFKVFAEQWGLKWPSTGYFNSGVLLIDLDLVRKDGVFRAAIEFVAREGHRCPYADQDALNVVTWGQWRPLPVTWNAQTNMVMPWLANDIPKSLQFHDRLPALVQFTGPGKPWVSGSYHPWFWVYWDNLARTPFLREVSRSAGIGTLSRLRIWLRWLRRKPRRRARNERALSRAAFNS